MSANKPGFFWFRVEENYCTAFNKFIKDGYVQTDKVLSWLKGIVTRVLNKFTPLNSDLLNFQFRTPRYHSEGGPALTLRMIGNFGVMDVDLVAAFKFGAEYWPQRPYREDPTRKNEFFIVPKKATTFLHNERYWRASFQDRERALINGKQRVKPALRLLKKMRNNLMHGNVSSYALKTIVLWELETGNFDWNSCLSDAFMKLLEKYEESLAKKKIPYYWNKGNNLLEPSEVLVNQHNEISAKIASIKRHYQNDPLIVAKVILKKKTDEYRLFMQKYGTKNAGGPLDFQVPNLAELEQPELEQLQSTSSAWPVIVGTGIAGIVAGLGYLLSRNQRRNQNN